MRKINTYNEIKDFVDSHNCKLITKREEFIKKNQPIKIKCGNCNEGIIKTKFSDFVKMKYKMCKDCRLLLNRTENFNKLKKNY